MKLFKKLTKTKKVKVKKELLQQLKSGPGLSNSKEQEILEQVIKDGGKIDIGA